MNKNIKQKSRNKILNFFVFSSIVSMSTFALLNSNEYINEEGLNPISNISQNNINMNKSYSEDSRIFPDYYKSIFINRYTQPIISMDPNNPGYLGVATPGYSDTVYLPKGIVWSGNSLLQSWAQDVSKHPDLIKLNSSSSTPIIANPVVLGGIHSDQGKTTNFKNQVILLIGDSNNFSKNKMAIIRYNTINGEPIVNTNPNILIPQNNYPIPNVDEPYSLTISYDRFNDRYVVYHPGLWADVKNNIFTFEILPDNSLDIKTNQEVFNTSNLPIDIFKDDNYLVSLSSVFSNNNKSMVLLFHSGNSFLENKNKFFVIETNSNMSISSPSAQENINYARTSVPNVSNITNDNGEFVISNNLFSKDFMPKLLINTNTWTYSPSVILPVLINNKYQFIKVAFYKNNIKNNFDNSHNGTMLSDESIFNSIKYYDMGYPIVWYDDKNINNQVITYNSSEINSNTISYSKLEYKFASNNPSDSVIVEPKIINIGTRIIPSSMARSYKSVAVFDYFNENNLIFSTPGSESTITFVEMKPDGTLDETEEIIKFAGRPYFNPYEKAKELGFFADPNIYLSGKLPSEMISEDLVAYSGRYNNMNNKLNYLFSWQNRYLSEDDILFEENVRLEKILNLSSNDTTGSLKGNIELSFNFIHEDIKIILKNKIPIDMIGFRKKESPTVFEIKDQNLLSQFLPSSINNSNIENIFSLSNIPEEANITWNISEPNNQSGTIKVSVTTNKYIDLQGNLVLAEKTFYLNNDNINPISGFKQIQGTSIKRNNLSVADLTIWDVNSNNIGNFIDLVDTVPNYPINVSYSITEEKPLDGSIKVIASITGGYYDPTNLGLPNPTSSSKVLNLDLIISGFKKISGATTILALPGDSNVPLEVFFNNPQNLINFIKINNPAPNSIVTISNARLKPTNDRVLLADVNLSFAYNTNGFIQKNISQTLEFIGFNTEVSQNTKLFAFSSMETSKKLPIEINDSNILNFIYFSRFPVDAKIIKFNYFNDVNVNSSSTSGGILSIDVTIDKYYLDGKLIEQPKTFGITLKGLKSLLKPTTIIPKIGPTNIYAQYFQADNLNQYLKIENGSSVLQKVTKIDIDKNTAIFNNKEGSYSFSYKISNYFSESGRFITKPKTQTIKIVGFKKIIDQTKLILKPGMLINDILPSKFIEEDWNKYFEISNLLLDSILPPEGPNITIINFDDLKGTITFRVSGIENFINEKYEIISEGSFDLVVDGFNFVAPKNDLLFIAIGSSIGVVVLIIIIGILIVYLLNRKRNKLKINKSNSNIKSLNSSLQTPPKPTRTLPINPPIKK